MKGRNACLLVASMALLVASFAQARDGRLRERIRERLQQRRDVASQLARDPLAPITAAGDYRFDIEHGGLRRTYAVHVPRSYRADRRAPLLVALHGGGGDMELQTDDSRYGLITKSEQVGYIAVFPNGFSRFPGGILATWNAGRCCGPARDNDIDDVGFIRRVVANVEHQLHVDRERVYATGMSNGGMMAYRLACDASDIFVAIAPVAGTDNTVTCRPSRPVSVAHFHARNDDHVPFDGGLGAATVERSMTTGYASVPATIARWVRLDGIAASPKRVLQRPGATCDLYAGPRDVPRVQLCVTDSGAHSWPGGHKDRGEPPSQAISANDEMWTFFDALQPRVPARNRAQ